jgi:hypothetical protein
VKIRLAAQREEKTSERDKEISSEKKVSETGGSEITIRGTCCAFWCFKYIESAIVMKKLSHRCGASAELMLSPIFN